MPDQSSSEVQQSVKTRYITKSTKFQGLVPEQIGVRGVVSRLKEQGLRGLFSSGQTESSSSMPFEAREEDTRERIDELTLRDQEERAQRFAEDLSELPLFDFSKERKLRRDLGRAQYISKRFLVEKAHRLGLPTGPIEGLRPRYIVERPKNEKGGRVLGESRWSGLVVVGVNSDPLETALTAAHELAHSAAGVMHEYRSGSTDRDIVIRGLGRYYYEQEEANDYQEGELLENAMAVWDSVDIYMQFKKRGLFQERIELREQILHGTTQEAREKLVKEKAREKHTPEYWEEWWNKRNASISLARKYGMPDVLIEPHIQSSGTVDQMILIWKIAELIGRHVSQNNEIDNRELLVERGREVLERSRFFGTREAHEYITQIFGDEAGIILNAGEHPESLDEVFGAIDRAEGNLKIQK